MNTTTNHQEEKQNNSLLSFLTANKDHLLLGCFLLIGIFARIYAFSRVPGEINQDEAFAGYDAYSLLYYGMDSSGHTLPVYLTAWGSGMNVLNTLLMIPFIALFGLKVWVIRIPQVLLAIITMPTAYLLTKKIFNKTAALSCLFFLAISPWHIMLSRWGLESNLAPAFLLMGLYFFLSGLENARYFYAAAVAYGLSLYCYATIWPIVPLIILCQILYAAKTKRIHIQKETIRSAIILFLFALPLLLFLLVNKGVLPEINLPFISIPKLVSMRSDEISLTNIPNNLKNLFHILVTQSDGLPWNSTDFYGIIYPFGMVFFVIGFIYYVYKMVKHIKNKENCDELFILIQLIAAIVLGALISVNINRINCIFLPIIIIASTGISELCCKFRKTILLIPFIVCLCFFIRFENYYFTDYKNIIESNFYIGAGEAVKEANLHKQDGTCLQITPNLCYSIVLFYQKEPVTTYHNTVKYANYPSPFLSVDSYNDCSFVFDAANPDENLTYILDASYDLTPFQNSGFQTKQFGNYIVLWK